MDSRHERSTRARSPLVEGAPLGAEMVLDTGLPEVRHRIALAYEEMRMVHITGPASPHQVLNFAVHRFYS